LVLGRRPLGAILHSSNEPGELSQWLCHDDSTINIVVLIIIIIITTYKSQDLCPSTLSSGSRNTGACSALSTLLVPSTRRATLGDRAFPVATALAWNALPSSVRISSTYLTFRRQLKTLLFKASFEDRI